MIQRFVDNFMEKKEELAEKYRAEAPKNYGAIVRDVVSLVSDGDWEEPDVSRITVIDHGDYQGTRLYVIGETGYQPSRYWSIFVNYGSCSGCDTFESIRGYSDEKPSEDQVKDYMTLALHMIQSMKEL